MTYQLPPPEPPAIVQSTPPGKSISTTATSISAMSAGVKAVAESTASPTSTSVAAMSAGAKALAVPTSPEMIALRESPFSTSRSAGDLRGTLAVGFPVQQVNPNIFAVNSTSGLDITDSGLGAGNKENSSPAPSTTDVPPQPRVQETIPVPTASPTPTAPAQEETSPVPAASPTPTVPSENPPPRRRTGTATPTDPTGTPVVRERIIEVTSDRQVYDEQRRTVTAEGNVIVRFDGGLLDADRVQVNLDNLFAVGQGNVALTRGDQILRGNKFTYNFVQDTGDMLGGSGEIFLPSAGTDLSFDLPTDVSAGGVPREPLSDRIRVNQPLTGVSSPGGVGVTVGSQRTIPFFPYRNKGE